MDGFLKKEDSERIDILNSYIDYLYRLEHEANRLIFMIAYNVLPKLEEYISSYRFALYSTKHAKKTIEMTKKILRDNAEHIPKQDFMEKVKNGGVQSELK